MSYLPYLRSIKTMPRVYRKREFSPEQMSAFVETIISTALKAYEIPQLWTQGKHWYRDAHDFTHTLCEIHDSIDLNIAAGVIAALSPMNEWGKNKRDAVKLLEYVALGVEPATRGLKQSWKQAEACYHKRWEYVLKGNKVRSFAHNIQYPMISSEVTIDRHMLRMLGLPCNESPSNTEYLQLVSCFTAATIRLNTILSETLVPNQVQAICWVWQIKLGGL